MFDFESAVLACARGDGAALRWLYETEGARLLGVARRIVRDTGRAEDVLHDAFVSVWRMAGRYDPALGDARGWLYTIVRNAALNAIRRGEREIGLDPAVLEPIDSAAALAAWDDERDAFEWRQVAGRLAPCLEDLEPVRRNCVLHAYVEGLSHAEIAERVGAPLGTVKSWIRRALLALRSCLE